MIDSMMGIRFIHVLSCKLAKLILLKFFFVESNYTHFFCGRDNNLITKHIIIRIGLVGAEVPVNLR